MVSEGKFITETTVLSKWSGSNCKWKQALSDISLSDVRSPHQFVAKGIKEDMAESFDYLYAVVGS